MPNLDLRAIEDRLTTRYADISNATEALLSALDDADALLAHCRALRQELQFRAGPVGDLALVAAAANDGLECEPTLGIDNMRAQLLAIREMGLVGTEKAAAVLAQAEDHV